MGSPFFVSFHVRFITAETDTGCHAEQLLLSIMDIGEKGSMCGKIIATIKQPYLFLQK